jgi:hypothetical protein
MAPYRLVEISIFHANACTMGAVQPTYLANNACALAGDHDKVLASNPIAAPWYILCVLFAWRVTYR